MSDQTKMDVPWYEKLFDKMGAFQEALVSGLGRLFGSSNERTIRGLGYVSTPRADTTHRVEVGSLLWKVNQLEPQMEKLTDAEIKALTDQFRARLEKGETDEEILPEAFAACREVARRTKKMRHYDVQIVGGAVLHRGNIAEMVTGEGKTLVATLPAYLNAISKKGVHVVTVNDYLARRDCEWMSPIYNALGVTAGFIQSDMDPVDRRKAYECDITYGTNSEFGFDYLRDNMKPARWGDDEYEPRDQQVQRGLHYAIIDEVDNILIDEARTPLIISGPAHSNPKRYADANKIAVQLTDLQRNDPNKFFEVKEKERTCHLTDEGVRKAEELAGVESFYTAGNMEWPHLIDNSLKAHHLYRKDKEYVVMQHPETHETSVIIVDEFTGRLMIGRQWSDGLHQAVEAKHARDGVKIKEETQTLATITLQNYFKLYDKLAGMTGTAMTEANEFWKIYKLDVIAIPTNVPLIRDNFPDSIYLTEKDKWNSVCDEIERITKWDVLHMDDGTVKIGTIRKEDDETMEFVAQGEKQKQTIKFDDVDVVERRGRPILIGTTDVDKSEKLSEMLKRRGIKHELLNAKPEYAAREAEIVAQAGRVGAVTISTNMAGRGTDIILGGNPETMAWAKLSDTYETRLDVPDDVWKKTVDEINAKEKMDEEHEEVVEMGGMHIVGTERHEARRIDNQLRGRAGRQGDPGSSRFFLCLEDDLMRIFAGEWVKKVLTSLGMEEGQAIESRMVSRRIEGAQKKVEERNFETRKHLLDYDEVMDHQRKRVYGFRQEVLHGANCKKRILDMIDSQIKAAVDRFLDEDYGTSSFAEMAGQRLGIELKASDFMRMGFDDADKLARDRALGMVGTMIHEMMEENLPVDVEDTSEWNWQALSNQANARWSLKTTERQLKKVGRDDLGEHLIALANASIYEIDLSKGKEYLEADWGLHQLCGWMNTKFDQQIEPSELAEKEPEEVRAIISDKVRKLYLQREIEFPITLAMARFMTERATVSGMSHRYDRNGLFQWTIRRFGKTEVKQEQTELDQDAGNVAVAVSTTTTVAVGDQSLSLEECQKMSRASLQDRLIALNRNGYPEKSHEEIEAFLVELLEGDDEFDDEDGEIIANWMKENLDIEIDPATMDELSLEEARDILWNHFDAKYRVEMKRMERSLVLNQLDSSWKNHLYTMDHLRQGIGLMGYAQVDPKTEYKRQGMREFDAMWAGMEDKVTDVVFRLETDESFEESVWSIGSTVHEEAAGALASIRSEQQEAIAGSQSSERKAAPIRNRKEKVGRNSPCPCNSGKKYKNCCLRKVG